MKFFKHKCVDCGVKTFTEDVDDNGQKIYRCMPCWLNPIARDIKLGINIIEKEIEK